jgi:hypothetical protein
MLKSLYYNIFYYKNWATCKLFPNYVANNIADLFFTPRNLPQLPYEAEFEKKTKHNILKIPTAGYKERASKFSENNKERPEMKLERIPEMPSEIIALEFLPEENADKKPATIVCVHGWEGRGTNFFKFIQKLTKKGFRVIAPDYPLHGKTGGTETGCHAFSFGLNCILNYLNEPAIILAHSLGNGATSMNYFISDEKTRKQIKGYIGIGVPDTFTEYILKFGNDVGLDEYTNNLFLQKNSERLGLDVKWFVLSYAITLFGCPCLLVHDENDKEVLIEWATKTSKCVPEQYKTYKIGDKTYPCLHKTKGLGHRRIMRDDGVVDVVVDFISNIQL